ncbi:MAG: hypothetical protein K6G07_00750 [Lachnospiraceae bacterium]|nr:hypothetical protein [Lachnospiraceae bacterium]
MESKYNRFIHPVIDIVVNEKSINAIKKRIGVSNVTIDLTAGYEASQAVFSLYNCYDYDEKQFMFDTAKDFILIGSPIQIFMGYDLALSEVFRGVITKVSFLMEEDDAPNIQVTAMDVKAVMMSNRYSRMLKATNYSDAVDEIFGQGVYESLRNAGVILSYEIAKTPDYLPPNPSGGVTAQETDKMIELQGESDYEFVVRVAKKFNYEFFVLGGRVYFRQAKCDSEKQITIDNDAMIKHMTVDYDITGLVEQVEVRGLDVSKAKVISSTKKNSNKLSQGNKVKSLINGTQFVYIDPTVMSQGEAGYRAQALMEDISYRYGSLDLEINGLPEILPGKFIKIKDLGKAISNNFYVQTVRHMMNAKGEYSTRIIGKAAKQGSSML